MAAPDTTKFQVNYKLADGTLVNLYAADAAELEKGLGDLAMVAALIKSTSVELGGTAVALNPTAVLKQGFPGATQVASVPTDAPSCAHGVMTFRTGQGAKGPWKGYFCPTPKGTPNQCDAIWAK